METLETVLLILLVADALALGVLVLIQQGKGADIGAAFGSGSANTLFGADGSASFLTRATTWLAIGFFLISFGLAYTAKERASDLRGIGVDAEVETEIEAVEERPADLEGDDLPAVGDDFPTAAPEELTPTDESLDSDLPDV